MRHPAALLSLLLIGCALQRPSQTGRLRPEQAEQTEQLLRAAGFRTIPAKTPDQRAHLEALPPLTLSYSRRDGRPHYWFADPYHCYCLWVGSDEDYRRYQKLRLERLGPGHDETALLNEEAKQQDELTKLIEPYGPFFVYPQVVVPIGPKDTGKPAR
jgi:hypothetical protein